MTQSKRLLLMFFATFILSSCSPKQETKIETEITTLEGKLEKTHPTWQALKGQWIVINYWAIWCNPCREEIPELNYIAQLEQVTMLGVNYDNTQGEALKSQAKELNIQFFTLLNDPSNKLGYSRPSVLPTTIIINPDGLLHATLLGPQTQDTITQALLPKN